MENLSDKEIIGQLENKLVKQVTNEQILKYINARKKSYKWDYISPPNFITTKNSEIKGYEIIGFINQKVFGSDNNPNEAREAMKNRAIEIGANAIIKMSSDIYTKSGSNNYKYTTHNYVGLPIVVGKKVKIDDQKKEQLSEEFHELIEDVEFHKYEELDIEHLLDTRSPRSTYSLIFKIIFILIILNLLYTFLLSNW